MEPGAGPASPFPGGARTGALHSASGVCSEAAGRKLARGSLLSREYSPSVAGFALIAGLFGDFVMLAPHGFSFGFRPRLFMPAFQRRRVDSMHFLLLTKKSACGFLHVVEGVVWRRRSGWSSDPFTLNKLECSKQAFFERPRIRQHGIMEQGGGPRFVGLQEEGVFSLLVRDRSND